MSLLVTAAAVVVITLRPFDKDVDLFGRGTLMMVVSALYLKLSEKYKRLFSIDAPKPPSWRERKATLAQVIEASPRISLEPRKRGAPRNLVDESGIRYLRSSILACVASSAAELVGVPEDRLCASLLVFPASEEPPTDPPRSMRVAARSSRTREVDVDYPCDEHLIAWQAILNNNIESVDDIKGGGHFPAPKFYRSVVAIPVTTGEKALGSLSIDSLNAFQFTKRSTDLAFLLQPYIALLVLTFPADASAVSCSYRRTQVLS